MRAQSERRRPRNDGRDAGRRRRESRERRAGRLGLGVQTGPRGARSRGNVRTFRRVAVRRRASGQERSQRRHRHDRAGQRKARDVFAARRRERSERAWTACHAVPVGTTRLESFRVDPGHTRRVGMSSRPISVPEAPQATWTPMIIIVLAQIMMIFNISTLQVSMDAIATSFEASATTVGTAIVTYALVVAALILPAARMAQRLGSRRLFRGAVLLFGAGMILMSVSPGVTIMILAQIVCGLAAAALVPTLVVLVADNYAGEQQAKALGWLGGAPAMGIVLAFLLAGLLTSWIGWRFMFALVAALAGAVFHLSNRLSAARKPSDVAIDWIGAVLAGLAILFISVGANNLTNWGVLLAKSDAPFSLLDMSPAPLMILADVFLVQAFVSWSRRSDARGAQALVALEVVGAAPERAALFSIFIISAIASAATFLIPLYVQVVQGRSSFDTALTVIPFSVASFIAAVLVVRLYGRASPAQIGRYSFLLVAAGL